MEAHCRLETGQFGYASVACKPTLSGGERLAEGPCFVFHLSLATKPSSKKTPRSEKEGVSVQQGTKTKRAADKARAM